MKSTIPAFLLACTFAVASTATASSPQPTPSTDASESRLDSAIDPIRKPTGERKLQFLRLELKIDMTKGIVFWKPRGMVTLTGPFPDVEAFIMSNPPVRAPLFDAASNAGNPANDIPAPAITDPPAFKSDPLILAPPSPPPFVVDPPTPNELPYTRWVIWGLHFGPSIWVEDTNPALKSAYSSGKMLYIRIF
jgi:hypothetical protein